MKPIQSFILTTLSVMTLTSCKTVTPASVQPANLSSRFGRTAIVVEYDGKTKSPVIANRAKAVMQGGNQFVGKAVKPIRKLDRVHTASEQHNAAGILGFYAAGSFVVGKAVGPITSLATSESRSRIDALPQVLTNASVRSAPSTKIGLATSAVLTPHLQEPPTIITGNTREVPQGFDTLIHVAVGYLGLTSSSDKGSPAAVYLTHTVSVYERSQPKSVFFVAHQSDPHRLRYWLKNDGENLEQHLLAGIQELAERSVTQLASIPDNSGAGLSVSVK